MRIALPLLAAVALAPHALDAVEAGEHAPALDGVSWIKGDPIAPGSGKPTIVEFWATWCPPCRQSIPHLGSLQRLYGDKIAIVGLSAEEDPEVVKTFVAKQGGVMSYRVGMVAQDVLPAWRGEDMTIPHAYLIDASGTVLWHGLPLSIDGPLARLVAGTWDAKREGEAAEVRAQLLKLLTTRGLKDADYERALALTGRLIELDPQDGGALESRLSLAQHLKHADVYDATLAAISTTTLAPDHLGIIGSDVIDGEIEWRRPDEAVRLVGAAYGRVPEDPVIANEWAMVLTTVGMLDQAKEAEGKAIASARTMGADTTSYEAAQRYIERLAALRAAGAPATGGAPTP